MFRRTVSVIVTLIAVLALSVPASIQGAEKSDAVLDVIPADIVFCVRINNLNQVTGVFDQFLTGIAPVSTGGLIKGPLTMMFGNPELQGLDANGSFAIFATAESSEAPPNIFFLLPVTDYKELLDPNFRVSQPDGNGISAVGTGPAGQFYISPVRSFALMSKDYGKLSSMATSIKEAKTTDLRTALLTEQVAQSSAEPIWCYANMVKVSAIYGSFVSEGIDGIKKQATNPGAAVQDQIDNLERVKSRILSSAPDIEAKVKDIRLKMERLKEQRDKTQADINDLTEKMKQTNNDKTKTAQFESLLQEKKKMLASVDEQFINLETIAKQTIEMDPNQNPAVLQINSQIAELKAKKQQLQGQKTPEMAASMIDLYGGILKDFIQQTKSITLVCNPRPAVLNFRVTVNALPGTEMAKMLTAESSLPRKNNLTGFTEDGAAMNFVGRMNKTSTKKMYAKFIDLFAPMTGKDANSPDIVKTKKLCVDMVDSMGELMVGAFSIDPNAKPPFDAKYVYEVKDANLFNKTMDEFAQVWAGSAFDDFYKNMGMESNFVIKHGVENYKGVTIDAATFSMKFTDMNSPEAQMLNTMYGRGFDYRWAIVDGLWVCRISSDPNSIYKLIDQVKAGPPAQPCAEVQNAMKLIPRADNADVFCTINYLRLMKGMLAFSPMPFTMPDIPTKSNLAFAAKVDNGAITIDIAAPKEHVIEMSTAFGMMMQQQMQQQMRQALPATPMQSQPAGN